MVSDFVDPTFGFMPLAVGRDHRPLWRDLGALASETGLSVPSPCSAFAITAAHETATLPSIRVEPDLREQLELVLHEGESLSAFVEASVRDDVRRRVDQADFMQRGIVSLKAARRSGDCVSADTVVRQLMTA